MDGPGAGRLGRHHWDGSRPSANPGTAPDQARWIDGRTLGRAVGSRDTNQGYPDGGISLNLSVRQGTRLIHGLRLANLFRVKDIHGGPDANAGSFFLVGVRSVVRLDWGRRRCLTWT